MHYFANQYFIAGVFKLFDINKKAQAVINVKIHLYSEICVKKRVSEKYLLSFKSMKYAFLPTMRIMFIYIYIFKILK